MDVPGSVGAGDAAANDRERSAGGGMRNLLGRLHARSPAELARIAAFWQVPLGGGDRHAQIGALYRTLIDPRAVRSAWERLGPDDRALVRLAGMLCIEQNDEWLVGRGYLSAESISLVLAEPDNHPNKETKEEVAQLQTA